MTFSPELEARFDKVLSREIATDKGNHRYTQMDTDKPFHLRESVFICGSNGFLNDVFC